MAKLDQWAFLDPMLSYAQNSEDVVLRRAFVGQSHGFYVDVGAGHPTWDSVTKFFYDNGWTGINIEPQPIFYDRLKKQRPKDVNLKIAIDTRKGNKTLTTFVGYEGLGTLDNSFLQELEQKGFKPSKMKVKVQTLEKVLKKYKPAQIDFIKIDVEGLEEQVLKSFDITRWQPKVFVIEATLPMGQVPTHHRWEHILLDAGYRFTLFDGLNRFYAIASDKNLCKRISLPANAFDGVIPYKFFVRLEPKWKGVSLPELLKAFET